MIVVDANILAYFFMEGGKTHLARQLREADARWVAPEIWRHEFANILVSACLFSKLPLPEAHRIWQEAEDMMRGGEYTSDVSSVLPLAVQSGATAYDAEYILLARSLGVPCVTEDGPLRERFPTNAVSMATFLGLRGSPTVVREKQAAYCVRRKR